MSSRTAPRFAASADEVLLRAVVEVALDPAPLAVGGGYDARPRRPQLLGLSLKLASDACRSESSRTLRRTRPVSARELRECGVDVVVELCVLAAARRR